MTLRAVAGGSGSGSGTVSSGTAGQLAYYSSSGTTVGGISTAPTVLTGLGPVPLWIKVGNAVSYTAFSTAATMNSIALFTLPAGGVIHGIKIKHSTAFAGTSITAYTVSVGISGTVAKYASAFNVFQTVSSTAFQLSGDFVEENDGATTGVLITATSTGANLSAATAGVVNVFALLSVAL